RSMPPARSIRTKSRSRCRRLSRAKPRKSSSNRDPNAKAPHPGPGEGLESGSGLARRVVAAGAGRWRCRGLRWRLVVARRQARSGRGLVALHPFGHLLQLGESRVELKGALIGIPGELIDRDRDAMAADPENPAGRDDEPVDLFAAGVHQSGRDMTDLAVIAAVNARPLDLGDVLLFQRICRRFFMHRRGGRGAGGGPRRAARRGRHLRGGGACQQRQCRNRSNRKLTHGTTPMLVSAFLPTRRLRSRFRFRPRDRITVEPWPVQIVTFVYEALLRSAITERFFFQIPASTDIVMTGKS